MMVDYGSVKPYSVLDGEAVLTQRVKYGGLEEKLLKIDIV